jgi:peroxiredoxin family protein
VPAPDKLSIVVYSGDAGRIHYALMMASSSVAIGKAATLFFTMEAVRALAAPLAPASEELLQASVELGARLMVCEAGLISVGLTRAHLRADLALQECGIVTFLHDVGERGQVLFI